MSQALRLPPGARGDCCDMLAQYLAVSLIMSACKARERLRSILRLSVSSSAERAGDSFFQPSSCQLTVQVRRIQLKDMIVVVEEIERGVRSGEKELHIHSLEFFCSFQ
jgi:hypothetical protein